MNNLLWFYFGVLSLGLVIVGILLFWQSRSYARLNLDIFSRTTPKPIIPKEGSNLHDTHAEDINASSLDHDQWIQQESDLLEKCDRLEALLNEKERELEKTQKALANELELRNGFTKMKDLLENEIAALKAKNHQLLAQFDVFRQEMEIPKDSVTSPQNQNI